MTSRKIQKTSEKSESPNAHENLNDSLIQIYQRLKDWDPKDFLIVDVNDKEHPVPNIHLKIYDFVNFLSSIEELNSNKDDFVEIFATYVDSSIENKESVSLYEQDSSIAITKDLVDESSNPEQFLENFIKSGKLINEILQYFVACANSQFEIKVDGNDQPLSLILSFFKSNNSNIPTQFPEKFKDSKYFSEWLKNFNALISIASGVSYSIHNRDTLFDGEVKFGFQVKSFETSVPNRLKMFVNVKIIFPKNSNSHFYFSGDNTIPFLDEHLKFTSHVIVEDSDYENFSQFRGIPKIIANSNNYIPLLANLDVNRLTKSQIKQNKTTLKSSSGYDSVINKVDEQIKDFLGQIKTKASNSSNSDEFKKLTFISSDAEYIMEDFLNTQVYLSTHKINPALQARPTTATAPVLSNFSLENYGTTLKKDILTNQNSLHYQLFIKPYAQKMPIKNFSQQWPELKNWLIQSLNIVPKSEGGTGGKGKNIFCEVCLNECTDLESPTIEIIVPNTDFKKKIPLPCLQHIFSQSDYNLNFCSFVNKFVFMGPLFTYCILCVSGECLDSAHLNKPFNIDNLNFPVHKNLGTGGPNLICNNHYNTINSVFVKHKDSKFKNENSKTAQEFKIKKDRITKEINNIQPLPFFYMDLTPYSRDNISNTKTIIQSLVFSISHNFNESPDHLISTPVNPKGNLINKILNLNLKYFF